MTEPDLLGHLEAAIATYGSIPIAESTALPPGTFLLMAPGQSAMLFQPRPPRWWREPRQWLRAASIQRRAARHERRTAEAKAWLALYRPDLYFVRWGPTGGFEVASRVASHIGWSLRWGDIAKEIASQERIALEVVRPIDFIRGLF